MGEGWSFLHKIDIMLQYSYIGIQILLLGLVELRGNVLDVL